MERRHEFRHEIRRTFRSREQKRRFAAIMKAHIHQACREYDLGSDSASIREHGQEWINHLAADSVTEGRQVRCAAVLKRLSKELPSDRLSEISAQALREWSSRRRKKCRASTVNQEIAILKAFARWCMEQKLWVADAHAMLWLSMPRLRHKERQPDPISTTEFGELAVGLPEHIRLPLVFQWCSGDRPGAWYALRWDDVHTPDPGGSGWVRLSMRKGGPHRAEDIPFMDGDVIHQVLSRAREMWAEIRGRPARGQDYVFITKRTGTQWDGQKFCRALAHHVGRAGLRTIVPYTVRHSVGTSLIRAGANAYQAQAALGHRDPKTTQRYVHLTGQDRLSSRRMIEQQLAPIFRPIIENAGG